MFASAGAEITAEELLTPTQQKPSRVTAPWETEPEESGLQNGPQILLQRPSGGATRTLTPVISIDLTEVLHSCSKSTKYRAVLIKVYFFFYVSSSKGRVGSAGSSDSMETSPWFRRRISGLMFLLLVSSKHILFIEPELSDPAGSAVFTPLRISSGYLHVDPLWKPGGSALEEKTSTCSFPETSTGELLF